MLVNTCRLSKILMTYVILLYMTRHSCLLLRYVNHINNMPHTELVVSTKPTPHRDSLMMCPYSPSIFSSGW